MPKVPCYVCGKDVRDADVPIILPAIKPPYRLPFCSLECVAKVGMKSITDRDDDPTPEVA